MASLVNQTGAAGVAAPMGGMAMMASPLQKVAVYVGDLADSVTEAHLFEVFNAIGPVASVRVCRDQITRRSLGYAYVNFAKHEDADRAIEEMNFTELHGKPMRMMWSERDPSKRRSNKGNLFVKNLHESIGSKELFDTFSLIGKIKSCRVVVDGKGVSRGYGFVAYEDEEAAELAVEKLNGMDVLGLQISVGPYKKPEKGAGVQWTNVYIKGFPRSWTEENLVSHFSKFGKITSSFVPMNKEVEGECRGFAFLNFETNEVAVKAVEEMNGKEVFELDAEGKPKKSEGDKKEEGDAAKADKEAEDDASEASKESKGSTKSSKSKGGSKPDKFILYCGRAESREERQRKLRMEHDQKDRERMEQFKGVNLYVKNIAAHVKDDDLRKAFEPYGTITSCRVMTDKGTGESKGFGFVCFSSPEEATKAVTEMMNKLVFGKPLYVSLAQSKQARHLQLQQRMAVGMGGPGMLQPGMGMGMPMGMHGPGAAAMFQQGMPAAMMAMQQQGMMGPGGRGPGGMQMGQGGFMGYPGQPGQPGMGGMDQLGRQMQQMGLGQQQGGQRGGQRGPGGPGAQRGGMRGQQPVQAGAQVGQQAKAQPAAGAGGIEAAGVSVASLAEMTEEQQKNTLGEKLYPLVHSYVGKNLAGKITGMLLEMDVPDLLGLLGDADELKAKVQEAQKVWDAYVKSEAEKQ